VATSADPAEARHQIEHALQELGHLSLVEFTQAGDVSERQRGVVVHPVIAEANRHYLRTDDGQVDSAQICRTAVHLIAAAAARLDVETPAHWPAFTSYGPHLHALFETTTPQLDDAHVGELLWTATITALAHYQYGAISETSMVPSARPSALRRPPWTG
jgi:hypothetical protein